MNKPLDGINLPVTGWIGLAVLALTALTQPDVQAGIVALITKPSVAGVVGAAGAIAGLFLVWVGKAPLTSSAPK